MRNFDIPDHPNIEWLPVNPDEWDSYADAEAEVEEAIVRRQQEQEAEREEQEAEEQEEFDSEQCLLYNA